MGSSGGPEPKTGQASSVAGELTERHAVGGGLVEIVLAVPEEARVSYVAAGQYTQIEAGGESGFFVMSSDPGASDWRFLTRGGGGASDRLLALPLGSAVSVSVAQGSGFPCDEARGRGLVIAVTGTGIAAARPLVRARQRDGEAHRTVVLVGVRRRSDVPLAVELDTWRARGTSVTVCLSADDATGPHFARGYVQDVLKDRARSLKGIVIFAAGVPEMIEALRSLAHEVGIREDDVYTNH